MLRGYAVPFLSLLLLSGCASAGSPAPAGTGGAPAVPGSGASAPQQPSEPPPQRGGVFQTIGLRDLPHLHPWTNVRNNVGQLVTGVYETLVTYEHKPFEDYREKYLVVPLLAESWELKDNTVYTFKLRRDVKWHDGEQFTAKDVEWSYESLADPANKLIGNASFQTMATVTAVDDYTIRIVTKQPDVEFLEKLTETPTAIMAKHAADRGDNFEKVATGTGPFKVESNDVKTGTSYVPNRSYWRQGMPYVDKWRMLPATDEAGRIAAFAAGQSDVLKVANKPQAETVLAGRKDAKVAPFFRDNTSDLFLKLDRPPFNDLRVRQALNMITDRQEMISTLTQGDGLMNPSGINPIRKNWAIPPSELEAMPGFRANKGQDVAQAKQLLMAAGASNLSFTIRYDRAHPDRPALAEMMSAQLAKAGVSAKLQPMESASFQKAFLDGDYEAAMYTGNAPDNWRQQIYSGATLNKMPVADPDLDRLIDAQAQEFDPARRAEYIRQLQRLLMQKTYVVPTITLVGYLLWQPYLHGWVDNQAANVGNLDWAQLWLDQSTAPKNR